MGARPQKAKKILCGTPGTTNGYIPLAGNLSKEVPGLGPRLPGCFDYTGIPGVLYRNARREKASGRRFLRLMKAELRGFAGVFWVDTKNPRPNFPLSF